jgi:hypothetical protein
MDKTIYTMLMYMGNRLVNRQYTQFNYKGLLVTIEKGIQCPVMGWQQYQHKHLRVSLQNTYTGAYIGALFYVPNFGIINTISAIKRMYNIMRSI